MGGKVAILSINDIRHITMIRVYTDYFDERSIPYEIICSERYGDESVKYGKAKLHLFKVAGTDASKARKLYDYLKFKKFAKNILLRERYTYVVVWNERTMSLFAGFLKKYGKYCVNVRDIWFPKNPLFLYNYYKSVKYSDFATWCAQKGINYLPKHDYIIVLNQNKKLVEGASKRHGFICEGEPIHIGVVGYIRHLDESKAFMKAFCNDSRYFLMFYGTGAEHLDEYAKSIGMNNVEIKGHFRPEETAGLLDKIDVINSYIGDGKDHLDQTLGAPIRFGYSTLLYKPAIVSPNTFLSEKTKELNIAYTADKLEVVADEFYKWYHSLSFENYAAGCNEYNKEYDDSIEKLHEVCQKKIINPIYGDGNV